MSLYDVYASANAKFKQQQNDQQSKSTFDQNDSFWNDYNMLNSEYRNQLAPYLQYSYKPGLWDRIGNVFGFNTAEDKTRLQVQDRARLALAGLLNDQFQNDYNSASSQSARLRDAGINPDLNGEVSGEAAAKTEQPFSSLDPSIFEQPVDIPDIVSIIGTAASSLQSAGQFANFLKDLGVKKAGILNTESQTTGIAISNMHEAYELAGDYLSGFDPEIRKQYPDFANTPESFSDTYIPWKIKNLKKAFPNYDDNALNLLSQAINMRKSDPRLYDSFYKAYTSAANNRIEKLATEESVGSLGVVDDYIKMNNGALYEYKVNALRLKYQSEQLLAAYDAQKYQNDFDFEVFKQKYKLPQNLAETQLKEFVTTKARYGMEQSRIALSKSYLDFVDKLRKSNSDDPYVQYLCQALLIGSFAPFGSWSASGGAFGISGSASGQFPFVPGADIPTLGNAFQSKNIPVNKERAIPPSTNVIINDPSQSPFSWRNIFRKKLGGSR